MNNANNANNANNVLNNNTFKMNCKQLGNGLELLDSINSETITDVFFDPQYRGVLDKLKYGNEGQKREKARCALPQMSEDVIKRFLSSIERVLKPSGYLFLWIDKFHLVEGISDWIKELPNLKPVDMITWDKDKIGMGYRTRRKSEYLVVLQKLPTLAKLTWTDHSIPDVWREKVHKVHAHSKPLELQKRLIQATTTENDVICDPASGGYSVFQCCQTLERNFIGCDLVCE